MKNVRDEAYNRAHSFRFAFDGWWFVVRTQHNAWIHTVASLAVIVLGFWLHISLLEWALVIVAMMIVWMGEFMNTAVEAVVDIASPEFHPLAKTAKDVAAAAVLIGAGGAVMVGLPVFGPKLWQLFFAG